MAGPLAVGPAPICESSETAMKERKGNFSPTRFFPAHFFSGLRTVCQNFVLVLGVLFTAAKQFDLLEKTNRLSLSHRLYIKLGRASGFKEGTNTEAPIAPAFYHLISRHRQKWLQ